jgi:hypothetical protein
MRGFRFVLVTATLLAGCNSSGGLPTATVDASRSSEAAAGDAPDVSSLDAWEASSTDARSAGDVGTAPEGSTASFTDPNPLPCAGMDAGALCLMGWPDMNHPFTGCCLTNFAQDPLGKCGVLSGSSACVERKRRAMRTRPVRVVVLTSLDVVSGGQGPAASLVTTLGASNTRRYISEGCRARPTMHTAPRIRNGSFARVHGLVFT